MNINRKGLAFAILLLLLCVFLESIPYILQDPAGPQGIGFAAHLKVGFAAVAALIILKASITRSGAPSSAVPAASDPNSALLLEPSLSVTYRSTPAASVRCQIYTSTHHWPTVLCLLLIPPPGAGWLYLHYWDLSPFPELITVSLSYAVALIAWLAVYALATWIMILQRFPSSNTNRICTSTLTPSGFQDKTPDTVRFHPWKSIIGIRERNGDVHVWNLGGGHFIPREAWPTLEEAQDFCRAAHALWKS
jgi:hypothetical protein